jgi:GAF domain-containing protein
LHERESIGAILLRRTEVHPFSDKQITLLQTLADQAVIATSNVRMFEEAQEQRAFAFFGGPADRPGSSRADRKTRHGLDSILLFSKFRNARIVAYALFLKIFP